MIMDKIALILVIIGGLNWGAIGLFGFDLVAFLFRSTEKIKADYPQLPACETYEELLAGIRGAL